MSEILKRNNDYYFMKTSGNSMWRAIKDGCKVLVKRTDVEKLCIGDIILYKSENQIVCHRLIKIKKNNTRFRLYTRGDSQILEGRVVQKNQYIGKVIAILKDNKLVNIDSKMRKIFNFIFVKFIFRIIKNFRLLKNKLSYFLDCINF